MTTELIGQRIETLLQRDAFVSRQCGNLGHHHRSSNAVFIHWSLTHQVAKRLLVAEHETQFGIIEHRAADPLEAGVRLTKVHARRGRHATE